MRVALNSQALFTNPIKRRHAHAVVASRQDKWKELYRAGLSIVPVVPWEGAPVDQLPNFYHAVLTFERSVYA